MTAIAAADDEHVVGALGDELAIRVEAHGASIVPFPWKPSRSVATSGIVTITLNRPAKKNAANGQMWDELLETFREIALEQRGSRRRASPARVATSAPAPTSPVAAPATRPASVGQMRHVGDVALACTGCRYRRSPRSAALPWAPDATWRSGCDLVVASDNARFSEIFARRGLSIDFGGSWVLPRIVGMHRAKELALFADIIDAAEAERIGLVNRVVPDAELDEFVADWATRWPPDRRSPWPMTKRMLNNSLQVTLEEALDDEGVAQTVNFGTADTAEAMKAFVEKREPRFEGR